MPNREALVDRQPIPDRPGFAAVSAHGLAKHFGGEQALHDVNLTVAAGSVHAVVGENGAGKSTLMRIMAGLEVPDAGTLEIYGEPVTFTPIAARDAGVALVHQELSLVPTLSIAENICLGDLPRTAGVLRRRALRDEAQAALSRVHSGLDVDEPVGHLSIANRQFVEIARALRQNPRILVLDEPTAALTPSEVDGLADLVARLAGQGITVIFVSHRISEVFRMCSTATVLKDGRKVADVDVSSSTQDDLVRLMVGRDLDHGTARAPRPNAPLVLRASGLETSAVHDISFELHAGEILGIGGLVGAGRSELLRATCRLDPLSSGTIEIQVDDRLVPVKSYRHAIRLGVAFVPEDRHLEGLALALSVTDNIVIPSADSLSRFGVLWRRSLRALGWDAIERYDIRTPSPGALVSSLSGGNQQKVVLGKWLLRPLRVLILDEPTRGVDVGAKAQLHDLLRLAGDQGVGVLIVSSDLPELLDLSDRILVVRDGQLTGELSGDQLTEEAVMSHATP
jgi:ABC-type sugar transport system ATPase subunit